MYRKAWCTCKPVVLLYKPIAVLTVSLPSPSSLLKLSIVASTTTAKKGTKGRDASTELLVC